MKTSTLVALYALSLVMSPVHLSGKPNSNPSTDERQSTQNPSPCRNNEQSPPNTDKIQETPPWYKSPEWWLVGLGVPTIAFLSYQAYVSRRAFVSTFRPKLVIRGIALVKGKVVESEGVEEIVRGLQWQIQCVIANTGGTDAHITESNLTVGIIGKTDLPPIPPYSKDRNSMGRLTIKSGEHKSLTIALDQGSQIMTFRLIGVYEERGNRLPTYCLGFIQYRDDSNVERRTAFLLQYDPESARFIRVENPDYTYSD